MNILLVQPKQNSNVKYCESPSQALLILGTLAKQRGHEVIIHHSDIDGKPNMEWADMVGITSNTFQCRNAAELYHEAKELDKQVVVGGPHAKYGNWNGTGVIGEGENAWLELLGETPNIKTIDDVPWPDYSLVDIRRFAGIKLVGAYPQMAIMASRGCPYECIFCNSPLFWGKKVRYRNPESVVEEVQRLHIDYGINEVYFQDDTFNINHAWAEEIFRGIIDKGLNKTMCFKIACRVNEKLITKEFLDLAYKAHVWCIFLGVESGSQKMLDTMKKGITVEESRRAIRMAKESHIRLQASFVIGLPGENLKTLRETEQFIKNNLMYLAGASIATPFPGTEFDRIITEKGHKKDTPYEEYQYGMCVVRTDVLDYDELRTWKFIIS